MDGNTTNQQRNSSRASAVSKQTEGGSNAIYWIILIAIVIGLIVVFIFLAKPYRPAWANTLASEIDSHTEDFWLTATEDDLDDEFGAVTNRMWCVFKSSGETLYNNILDDQGSVYPTGSFSLLEFQEAAIYSYGYCKRTGGPDLTGAVTSVTYRYVAKCFVDSDGFARYVRVGQAVA